MIQVVFITNLRIILRYRHIPLVINRFMCFSLPIMDKNHNMFNFVVINHLCLLPGFQVYSCDAIVSKAAQVGKVSTTVVEDLTIAHSVQLQVDAKQYKIQIIVFALFTRVLTPSTHHRGSASAPTASLWPCFCKRHPVVCCCVTMSGVSVTQRVPR